MAATLLAATALLGAAFLIVKGFEYHEDIHEHLVPGQTFKLTDPATQIFSRSTGASPASTRCI